MPCLSADKTPFSTSLVRKVAKKIVVGEVESFKVKPNLLEDMVGKKVMVLVNLKPAKLAGVLSEGMLLCAEDAEGNLALMTPEKEMPAGAEIC